jgi:methionyl-tRNA formyltransferase
VTVMLMDEGMDTGPILATVETAIDPEEDAGRLGARLAEMGAPLLIETLRGLERGTVEPRSQDHTEATYAAKLLPDERMIDWTNRADSIVRRIRAFAPEPGAVTKFRRGRLKILRAAELPPLGGWIPESPPMPARISLRSDGRVSVDAGGATQVELLEVAPAGRKEMTGAEWARGARIEPLDHLG